MKFQDLKNFFILIFFFTISLFFLINNIYAESPYFYSCVLAATPTVIQTPVVTITSVPTTVPTSTSFPTSTPFPTPTSLPNCQLKMGTGERTKADLVVLAEDYNNNNDFLAAVDKAVVALNKTNLGTARLGKINLWALMDLNQTFFKGFNCPTANGVTVACWDHVKAFNLAASKCGGDSYLIFNNDTHRTGSIGGISIWGGTYIYNFALDQPTVPHELGHSLTGLMDEYSFGIAAPAGAVAGLNCSELPSQSQTVPCPKWANRFPNVGCYPRCGFTNFYRPAVRSIMDRGGTGAVYDFNEPSLIDGWDEMLKLFP
ncbi:hypothetical protein A2767_00885 [Candidatus Roizmanbacteria bacterium RIFCSPHIGHO2_01_FULL_35_10]|uniref:Uncharacterized protein n=1 Tax=Candidatus Roizmanbacteria bacterium RIFCSPLOWO2_01_FULL_35_13 TaxID=1802055 RepID=A0A1F7IDD4_9BACT|nr:MAG: hypothetical protein A2767_00885 [Candidatus Roizmanbacteria bacterium RIFCSPHIGHO2_01_FULL_35_10]OGK41358.1 MAG: hypothetical protein A3A74_03430 [Candidatus Roizmanbacteria bacterium RIFCSPLOWO2_01_FULL_35_13]